MEFWIGDFVQVEPALLKAPLAIMPGNKARKLVGRLGIVVDRFPLSDRPWLVEVPVEGSPVYVRLRREELSLVASPAPDVFFGRPATQPCFVQ